MLCASTTSFILSGSHAPSFHSFHLNPIDNLSLPPSYPPPLLPVLIISIATHGTPSSSSNQTFHQEIRIPQPKNATMMKTTSHVRALSWACGEAVISGEKAVLNNGTEGLDGRILFPLLLMVDCKVHRERYRYTSSKLSLSTPFPLLSFSQTHSLPLPLRQSSQASLDMTIGQLT